MAKHDEPLHKSLAPRRPHVVERKVLEHLRAHVPRDGRDVEQAEDRDRHDRLPDLEHEAVEVVDLSR